MTGNLRAFQVIEGNVGCNLPCPGPKATCRVESRTGSVNSPESLDCQILRRRWIAHDAHDPSVNFVLELTEQGLEGREFAHGELLEHLGRLFQCLHLSFVLYKYLLPARGRGFTFSAGRQIDV